MNRAAVAADVIAEIVSCWGSVCPYRIFRSRGIPPAECDSIALAWLDGRTTSNNDCGSMRCDEYSRRHTLLIALTKCCLAPDGSIAGFDPVSEDAEARCFYDDVDLLERCMMCADFTVLLRTHGLEKVEYTMTRFDEMTQGGCMTAYIELAFLETYCCP